jgi:hypothetical protein
MRTSVGFCSYDFRVVAMCWLEWIRDEVNFGMGMEKIEEFFVINEETFVVSILSGSLH